MMPKPDPADMPKLEEWRRRRSRNGGKEVVTITLEEFLERRPNDEHHRTVRCYCNDPLCPGWAQQYLWNDGMGEEGIRAWEMEIDELGPGQ